MPAIIGGGIAKLYECARVARFVPANVEERQNTFKIFQKKVSKVYIQGWNRVLGYAYGRAANDLAVPRRTVSGNFPSIIFFSGVVTHGMPIQNQNC